MLQTEYSFDTELAVRAKEERKAGILLGMQKGIQQGMLTTATRMKKANFDVSTIIEMTGLSKEIIEKL